MTLALLHLKWRHAGQACVTANRIYVQSGVYDQVAKLICERTNNLVIGHGADPNTTIGPVTTPQSLERIKAQVEDAKKCGGHIAVGGRRVPDTKGYFFEPTVILNASAEMLITKEETFGPILAMYKFETEDAAVKAANDTSVCAQLKSKFHCRHTLLTT